MQPILPAMTVARPMKKCPFCRETIAATATRCKHCQADLEGAAGARGKSWLAQYNTFRIGFVTGILFSLILAVLAYGHFNWGG